MVACLTHSLTCSNFQNGAFICRHESGGLAQNWRGLRPQPKTATVQPVNTMQPRTATNNMRYSTGTRIAIESDTVLTSVQPYGRADTHVPTPANHQT